MSQSEPSSASSPEVASSTPRWKPLNAVQRRVAGVLVEKAKTTPEQYPLSLNALTNGCNQKNNRHPVTSLTQDQVEQAIDELREMGAAVEVQGTGRVPKDKHCLYEWLEVDKAELAVMAELLLRGEQTIGELRARAARMEPLPDLAVLRPILDRLKSKGLLLELTPEGRGQVISHNLYRDRELAELKGRVAALPADTHDEAAASTPASPSPAASPGRAVTLDMFNELQLEVAELRAEVARLRDQLQQLTQ
jgi:uncharacterized protein YceH (UPF0502 family)